MLSLLALPLCARLELNIGVTTQNFHYTEEPAPSTPRSDRIHINGQLAGPRFTLDGQFGRRRYWKLYGQYFDGDPHYDGYTQSGVDLNSDVMNEHTSAGLHIGEDKESLVAYTGLEYAEISAYACST